MSRVQTCSGSQVDFDLSEFPAERIEKNRGFGLFVTLFSLPFLVATVGAAVFSINAGDWLFFGVASFFTLVPLVILVFGLLNLLTVIQTTIDREFIEETRTNPFRETSWREPLNRFTLQVKITVLIHERTHRHTQTFHVRLRHADDFKSIELFSTESSEELAERYREYTQQLDVKIDPHVRDYNTDKPISDLATYGLDS